jgi:capsule polysaccharide modification protein KpsS
MQFNEARKEQTMKDVARLRKKDLKAWVPVDDEVRILCRYISQADWEDLRAQSSETTINTTTGLAEIKEDKNLFNLLLAARVVIDVEGLVDSDDLDEQGNSRPLKITSENIELLMTDWTEFRLAVRDAPLSFERMLILEQEQKKKN